MKDQMYSMQDLEKMFSSPQQKIQLRWVTYATYESFCSIIEDAIDLIFRMFEENPKYKKDFNEDEMSIGIVENLRSLGIPASHDTMFGGHCDLVVKGKDDYTWLGEAKKHGSYDWLLKGFSQLDTRYMAPAQGRDRGAMLIYCFGARSDIVLDNWVKHLLVNRPDVSVEHYDEDSIRYTTKHRHSRNGRTVVVRHAIASLYFKPEDG